MCKCNNENLSKYISILSRQGSTYLSKQYGKFGIGSGQYMFMIHLYKNDGINQENLSEILSIDKGTTAKALKKLEELNLVTRTKDSTDKRVNKIYVTPKALAIKDEFFEILSTWESTLTNGLSPAEFEFTLSILKKLSQNIITKEID